MFLEEEGEDEGHELSVPHWEGMASSSPAHLRLAHFSGGGGEQGGGLELVAPGSWERIGCESSQLVCLVMIVWHGGSIHTTAIDKRSSGVLNTSPCTPVEREQDHLSSQIYLEELSLTLLHVSGTGEMRGVGWGTVPSVPVGGLGSVEQGTTLLTLRHLGTRL